VGNLSARCSLQCRTDSPYAQNAFSAGWSQMKHLVRRNLHLPKKREYEFRSVSRSYLMSLPKLREAIHSQVNSAAECQGRDATNLYRSGIIAQT
jgi:hypothetical protein